MEIDFLIIGRIGLIIISLALISLVIYAKIKSRIGTEFFSIIMIFWVGVLVISINPRLLDAVLNNTGFVNRAQFLLSISIAFIVYLLIYQTRKGKIASENLGKTIRKIALDYFKRELSIKKNHPDVVIVIVAKDEERTIGSLIDGINSLNLPFSYEILVVNDGSTDNTERISREKGAMIVVHYHNLGVGAANKTGYLACHYLSPKIVVTIDGDGQHDPQYIPILVSKIKEGYDLVYGSRFAEESKYESNTIRFMGNKFYTNLVNRIGKISITDVTSGYRAIKFDKIKSIYYFAESNFAIELALRAAKNGLKITEIPTESEKRIFGQSQFHKIERFLIYNINAITQIINANVRNPKIPNFEE